MNLNLFKCFTNVTNLLSFYFHFYVLLFFKLRARSFYIGRSVCLLVGLSKKCQKLSKTCQKLSNTCQKLWKKRFQGIQGLCKCTDLLHWCMTSIFVLRSCHKHEKSQPIHNLCINTRSCLWPEQHFLVLHQLNNKLITLN